MTKDRQFSISISREYMLFAAITIVIISVIMIASLFVLSGIKEDNRRERLPEIASSIDNIVTSSFDLVYREMQSIGSKIDQPGKNTTENINYLFSRSFVLDVEFDLDNLFYWPPFSWVDKSGKEIVNSEKGILTLPNPVEKKASLYLSTKHPLQLHFSAPEIREGISMILPAAMGVTSKNGEYLGSILTYFDIKLISKEIFQALSKNISFIILNEEKRIILAADEELVGKHMNSLKSRLTATNENNFLDDNIKYNSNTYSYYTPSKKYPFTVLVGYTNQYIYAQKEVLFLQYIPLVALFTAIFLVVLLLFYRRNIYPLVQISKIADEIADGREDITFPNLQNKALEIRNLKKKIEGIVQFIKREKEHKNELEEARDRAAESYLAQEEFLSKVNHELRTPLNSVKGFAEMMLREEHGSLPQAYKNYAKHIFDSSAELESMMVNIINPVDVNVEKLIKNCVKVQTNMAEIVRNVTITTDIEESIPSIYADETRLNQMMVALLHRALASTPKGKNIHINIYTETLSDESRNLVIVVEDSGFGMTEEEMEKIIGDLDKEGVSRRTDGRDLKYSDIHKITALHHGVFHMESQKSEGNTVTIKIPYRSKEEIAIMPPELGVNVLQFPKPAKE